MNQDNNNYDSDDETEPLYETARQQQERKAWDVFEDPPTTVSSASMEESKWIDRSVVALKYIIYILTFLIVLGAAAVSKGTLLFVTSQIKDNITRPYCNRELGINQQFIVTIPNVERVAWIWVLMFIYFVPEVGTFIRSVRICIFKSWKKPTMGEFMLYFITETLPCIGSAILVFAVLPDLDVVKGTMLTNAVCLVPGFMLFITRNPKTSDGALKMILDITSVTAQASALVVWPLIEQKLELIAIPLSVFLISCGWWENFVCKESPVPFLSHYGQKIKKFENGRYLAYIFISLWKCLLFFGSALVIIYLREGNVDFVFSNLSEAFMDHTINITEVEPIIGGTTTDISDVIQIGNGTQITTYYMTPLWVFIINFLATYICYAFGKFTCRILIQGFSYAFPVNLAVPVTLSGLIAMCGTYISDECAYYGSIPGYLFFNSPDVYFLKDFISQQHSWIWLLWLLSQTWITIHIWTPSSERLAKTERLYVKPLYDAFLIDQSLALNRRRDDKLSSLEEDKIIYGEDREEEVRNDPVATEQRNRDTIPRIYCCGTMWHETEEEMMEFLKSIMRLDEDQCSRRIVRNFMGYDDDEDYYELETHVFFDDAFVRKNKDDNDPHVNDYVLQLASALDRAASTVHETHIRLRPPILYITPYGGRAVWTLPGKTKMIVHLKDKTKIRAKKRWSQVMYMYYLLGHRLMERDDLSPVRKDVIAENTYLLALDGDIDFQAQAVHLLIYRMKKDRTLAAACGRIHPIGSGPMVWYQKFEYAIGHWLQKATEHVIGCVLCSPGCFSLFRGKALMDDSVMKKYTTKSERPLHYVQYDQGEDRWLCTLLLQRGYRVEYSAASDAYTHCPESFNEFYNQRRRWVPSTTLNILDLLMESKRTVKINDNISLLYIIYQIVIMVGTVVGPGTIFLMLVGAFVSAFQMDQFTSFLWNIVPILIFLIACSCFESNIQLFIAGLLSAIYGLVMMAVLIGIILQIDNDGILAPSSLFLFCVAGEMIVTALFHPKELNCLKFGIVYYITVPSMYMLLIIYSVFNMNNVSWGTREATVIKEPDPNTPEEAKAPKKKTLGFFGSNADDNKGSIEFVLAGLFKCMFCTHKEDSPENEHFKLIQASLEVITKRLDHLESLCSNPNEHIEIRSSHRRTTILEGARASRGIPKTSAQPTFGSEIGDEMSDVEPNNWLYDGELAKGIVDFLPNKEEEFWKQLIEKYLYPIDDNEDKKRKAEIEKGLKDLRDKAAVAFIMINALFVLVVFLLTLKKDLIHIRWPLDIKYNFTYQDDSGEIRLSKTYLELEPIGLVFVLFFAVLLVVQFFCMLYHRYGTLSEVLLTTPINLSCFKKTPDQMDKEELLEDPVKVTKALQKLKGVEDLEEEVPEEAVGRRKTVYNLDKSRHKPQQNVNDLDVAFKRRLAKFKKNPGVVGPVPRKTILAINQRRQTQAALRRSQPISISDLGLDKNLIERTYGTAS